MTTKKRGKGEKQKKIKKNIKRPKKRALGNHLSAIFVMDWFLLFRELPAARSSFFGDHSDIKKRSIT
jgi:hypothetical protein